ncbi:hypothetical protein BH10CYA1_BH10CYA1_48380 [soil metagenome]
MVKNICQRHPSFALTPTISLIFSQCGVAFAQPAVRPQAARMTAASLDLFKGTISSEEQKDTDRVMTKKNPRKILSAYTDKLPHLQGAVVMDMGTTFYVHNASLSRTIPHKLFYVLRFRQFPVAIALPQPYGSNNIFAVDKNGTVEMITSTDKLKQLFERNVHGINSDTAAKNIVKAWLVLAQELAQDGLFHFSIPESGISRLETHDMTYKGKSVVEQHAANSGQIEATVAFTPSGEIKSIEQSITLRAGMRPICQSTKLLDNDPIVRKMAEQDLLIMGKDAKPYLDQQRSKVSPALRDAIDRVWQRIIIEGR